MGEEESVTEALVCCFIPCEDGECSSSEMSIVEGVKEASACRFSSCEE